MVLLFEDWTGPALEESEATGKWCFVQAVFCFMLCNLCNVEVQLLFLTELLNSFYPVIGAEYDWQ